MFGTIAAGRLGAIGATAGGAGGPSLDLTFASTGSLDPSITFTRASSATYFDATGTLQSAGNNVPRFDYNPANLAARGLLLEEARTNAVANNTMVGVVAGSPGTSPTGWAVTGSANNVTRTIVGTGVENGIAYIDVQYTTGGGTTSASGVFNILPTTTTAVAATSGQTWTGSAYVKLQAGSLSNLTNITTVLVGRDSGGTLLENTSLVIAPTNAALNTQRYVVSRTLSNASTVFVTVTAFQANYASGVTIDVTLRIGLPQLEQGAFATSVIQTSGTAATRSVETASINTLGAWYNATEGTLFSEGTIPFNNLAAIPTIGGGFSNGTLGSRVNQFASAGGVGTSISTGGVDQGSTAVSGTVVPGAIYKMASTIKQNDCVSAWSGTVGAVDTTVTLPTVTQLGIGSVAGVVDSSLYVRRLTYYPRRLSSTELQAITS